MYPVFHRCKIFVSWLFYWIIMPSTSLPSHTLRHIIARDDMILHAAGKSVFDTTELESTTNNWLDLDPSDLESVSKAAQSSTAWVQVKIAWWIIKWPPPTLIDIISPLYTFHTGEWECSELWIKGRSHPHPNYVKQSFKLKHNKTYAQAAALIARLNKYF